ncbi:MAG TPA: diguanylate cyclase [Patescibacteria group bacterium]|nr:diguanylate cyclase [Patescibacteria group bacterium]
MDKVFSEDARTAPGVLAESELLTECLLTFEADPKRNINQLIALCGERMGADWTVYYRLYNERFQILGAWPLSPEVSIIGEPEKRLYGDLVHDYRDTPQILRDWDLLLKQGDGPVAGKKKIQTCVGRVVVLNEQPVGALCAFYAGDTEFDTGRLWMMNTITRAVTVEEARQQEMERLAESERHFRLIAENANAVVWTMDAATFRFTYIGSAIKKMRGLTPEAAMAEPLEAALTPASQQLFYKSVGEIVDRYRKTGDFYCYPESLEMEQPCADGRIIQVEMNISAIFDAEGNIQEVIGISRDITERKAAAAQLLYLSTHDTMTGLYNRSYFDTELNRASRSRRMPVSIIIADLDGLKRVNDQYGHSEGDQLIKKAAAILRLAFRGDDVIARVGGDEFAVLLYEMDEAGAAASLARIRECEAAYNARQSGSPVRLSMGAGTALVGERMIPVYQAADNAMYAEKRRRKKAGWLWNGRLRRDQ